MALPEMRKEGSVQPHALPLVRKEDGLGWKPTERGKGAMQEITHGALFSGSGGFELAARMCGISSIWASEIEPFPIKVTKARFPDMEHIGDIGMVDGAKIPPVDIISGGSPCQDMSIAGRRQGLKGERSVLFMDYIRIVKEMRK